MFGRLDMGPARLRAYVLARTSSNYFYCDEEDSDRAVDDVQPKKIDNT